MAAKWKHQANKVAKEQTMATVQKLARKQQFYNHTLFCVTVYVAPSGVSGATNFTFSYITRPYVPGFIFKNAIK